MFAMTPLSFRSSCAVVPASTIRLIPNRLHRWNAGRSIPSKRQCRGARYRILPPTGRHFSPTYSPPLPNFNRAVAGWSLGAEWRACERSSPYPQSLVISILAFRQSARGGCRHSLRTSDEKALGGGIQPRRREPRGFGKRSGNFQRWMQATSFCQNGVAAWPRIARAGGHASRRVRRPSAPRVETAPDPSNRRFVFVFDAVNIEARLNARSDSRSRVSFS